MDTPIISLRGISREYTAGDGSRVKVLDDVTLDIQPGTLTVIRGESGSGKTTLLRILGILDSGFEGDYLFEKTPVNGQPDWYLDELRANNLGFIFQEGRLFGHMTLRRNIEVPLVLHGERDPGAVRDKIRALEPTFFSPDEIGNGTIEKEPRKVSGGQAQRGSIMRAIVDRPSIILADEPTASLHGDLKLEVVRHLQALTEAGHTVIVVSHDSVFYDAGRQLELVRGQLVELETKEPATESAPRIPSRMPEEGGAILNGWRPRAPLGILIQQALRETFFRPIFLSLILVSLIVGVCQVSVFTSVIVGAQVFVNEKITEGSRLNRIQIKPRMRDRTEDIRFPVRDEISAMPEVQHVIERRVTTTRVQKLDGSAGTFAVSGLHAGDPEYGLLSFAAGGAFSQSGDRPEVIVTAGLLAETFDLSGVEAGTEQYSDFLGRTITVLVNRYNTDRKPVGEEAIALEIKGVILNGEGGRQLYLPNRTLLLLDALIRDRTLEFRMPEGAGPDNWPETAVIAERTNFPWQDSLHVYAREIREILPLYSALSKMGYRPESDIWDYKWALDIQDTAWRVFLPLLVLIVAAVAITVMANIYTSAKLREAELALWRVLGMRRGDLVTTQVLSIFFSVTTGALAGLALGAVLIDRTRAMLRSRSEETAAATGQEAQDFDAIFAPVADFFWPLILGAVVVGLAAALYPAIRTAATDPAKVLQS